MALGGFEVEWGFIAERPVQAGAVVKASNVFENHEFCPLSGVRNVLAHPDSTDLQDP